MGALGSTETTAQVHPARFTGALVAAAQGLGAELRLGVVDEVVTRDGAAHGVAVDGRPFEADAVVVAMGPWTGRLGGLGLPAVRGLKGYSVTLAAADVPAHALFVDYRTAEGRQLEPEIIPRPDGEVYVCGMADPAPLPDSPDQVEVREAACAVLARAAARVSSTLADAAITRRQACYRPVTDDGLPLIGRVPGIAAAYVATGHGPWGMLNAPATGLALAEQIIDGRGRISGPAPLRSRRLEASEVWGDRPRDAGDSCEPAFYLSAGITCLVRISRLRISCAVGRDRRGSAPRRPRSRRAPPGADRDDRSERALCRRRPSCQDLAVGERASARLRLTLLDRTRPRRAPSAPA